MRSFMYRLGFVGTTLVVLAVLLGAFAISQAKACNTAVVGGGAFSVVQAPQYVVAQPQLMVVAQPVVRQQVYVQPQRVQVQAVAQVQRVYAQPQLIVQPQYVAQAQVAAVAVGRQPNRFALRPRLQRAANIGASSAIGAPARVVR